MMRKDIKNPNKATEGKFQKFQTRVTTKKLLLNPGSADCVSPGSRDGQLINLYFLCFRVLAFPWQPDLLLGSAEAVERWQPVCVTSKTSRAWFNREGRVNSEAAVFSHPSLEVTPARCPRR